MSERSEIIMHQHEAWRIAGPVSAALLLLTFVLYQQSVLYLTGKWNEFETGDYGHGYLVLLISAYLIFYNRQRLAALTPCPEYRAILVVLMVSALWLMAALVNIEILQALGLLLLALSILWALLGTPIIRILVFPVLYISFAIPIWFPLSPLLQEFTADVVFWVIRLLEIPALRIENMIVLPSGRLSVEESCAGLRYLMAALTLGTLFAYLNYASLQARLIVVLVFAGTAVLANLLRVYIVVYLAYTTDMQHPYVQDHLALGWYLFAGLVAALLIIDTLLHRRRLHNSKATPDATPDTIVYKQGACNKGKSQFVVMVMTAVLLIAAGPAIIFWTNNQPQPASYLLPSKLSLNTEEWSVMDGKEDDWLPQYRGAIDYKIVFQDKSSREIYLYMGMYPVQTQGEELISSLNKISDDEFWRTGYQRALLKEINGHRVLEQLLQNNAGNQRLVWYWYHVAGQGTVNKYQAKALQVLGLLNGKRQASIIAIAARLDDEPENTRKILAKFAAEMGPSLIRVADEN